MIDPTDAKKLKEVVAHLLTEEDPADNAVEAFEGMLTRNRPLSPKQKAWLYDVYDKLFGESQTLNLWSSGQVPRGSNLATPVPEVLKKPLPLKPPGRC